MASPKQHARSDQESFRELLDRHKGILYKVSHAYCRNPGDREDLAQEILVQLWRSFPQFDGRCRFSTWMYRIALNVAISSYRRETTRARYVVADNERVLEAVNPDSKPEDVQLLYRFIERLDELNKALALLYLDGNSYQEIAAVLGITETNAATKINRLKSAMKQEFQTTR
jgi:RNA polymerase sigma-70 factor (ECF subfamily)